VSDTDALRLLDFAALLAWWLYIFPSQWLRISRLLWPGVERPIALRLRRELKPIALPSLVLMSALDFPTGDGGFMSGVAFGLNLMLWWAYRDDPDDDDRWKRRREQLAAKVAEVGGRLQVVPVRAS
jgi:hypothetical protein